MNQTALDRMNTDELWSLHVEVSQLLQQRIQAEKLRLEERLKLLEAQSQGVGRIRRYPRNIAIQISRQRLGPVVASSRAGWSRS